MVKTWEVHWDGTNLPSIKAVFVLVKGGKCRHRNGIYNAVETYGNKMQLF